MRNVLEYLEASATRVPRKTAVIDENGSITYEELLDLSRRTGSFLTGRNIHTNRPVPVFMEKGAAALASFFGIVYAGCFYVLLNPELPEARLKNIIDRLDPEILLTDQEHREAAAALLEADKVALFAEASSAAVNTAALANVRAAMVDTDPLYANFTSGSTGVPKGVVIGHRSVLDFIDIFTDTFGFSETDRIANQAPFDFDVSVKDIYTSIKTGATLVIVPKRLFSLPVELLDFLCDNQVTVMIWAVSALCLITTFHGLDYKVPQTVRKVLFSGEVMPMKHLKQWMEKLPEAEFVNLYGPTEITCNCAYHVIDRERRYEDGIPTGKAFPNERVFLLNGNEPVTEPGEVGEICVTGSCLALGYFKDPEQTDKHFMQNPLTQGYYDRMYRTGDLACLNEQGELVFKGRKDFQIKYQGHRIELEEIESAMMQVPGIERSCCVFDEKRGRLFGYFVGSVDPVDLERELLKTLPAFLVPKRLLPIEAMPMTKNGKIDRKELLERAVSRRR